VVSKAWGWMKGDQSDWSKLTLGEDGMMEISPKAKVYVRGL